MKMKKMVLLLAVFVFLTAVAASCSSNPAKDDSKYGKYVKVSPDEVKAALDAKEKVIIVDVRTDSEYAAGHIPGAILVPDAYIETMASNKLPDKLAKIIVYCQSGRRSEIAASVLLTLGYRYVSDMGGIADWTFKTVTGDAPGSWI
jgi:phage shock protein E